MKHLKKINEMVESRESKLVSKIKTMIEDCYRKYEVPKKYKDEVFLDSCDDFKFRGKRIDVIGVGKTGLSCEDGKKISWNDAIDFEVKYLEEILNNLEGTIFNEIR